MPYLGMNALRGRGGIAQYKRDIFGALAETHAVALITARRSASARSSSCLPERVEQSLARLGFPIRSLRCVRLCSGGSICGATHSDPDAHVREVRTLFGRERSARGAGSAWSRLTDVT